MTENLPTNTLEITLPESLTRNDVESIDKKYIQQISKTHKHILINLKNIKTIDSTGAALIAAIRAKANSMQIPISIENHSPLTLKFLDAIQTNEAPAKPKPTFTDFLVSTADKAILVKKRILDYLYLLADTIIWSFGGAKKTQRVRKSAIWLEAYKIGLTALPIVALIAFLVGTVISLQAASLLKQFGADIMVADMIGISMTREMAPLMTAIIMAGRSAASIAAEIATMTINEEISGIKTMGLEPVKYIVVPKFRAITLTMPPLTVFANLTGIFGGFLIAVFYMDIGIQAFLLQLSAAVTAKDIITGIIKSLFFAWIIVSVAAHQGFNAYGGAESVGRVTTSSVVLSIFWCIVADAIFSIIFWF